MGNLSSPELFELFKINFTPKPELLHVHLGLNSNEEKPFHGDVGSVVDDLAARQRRVPVKHFHRGAVA